MDEEYDESFGGRVMVDFGDGPPEGIVVGHVEDTSTALIVLSDMRHLLYTVPDGLFDPWQGLEDRGAAFFCAKRNEIGNY
jgi:hypothetical protein